MTGYSKTNWVDRSIQYPNRFTRTSDGTYDTLTPAPGTITNAGTPLTAAALNNLEMQYDQAIAYFNAQTMLQKDQFNATDPPVSYPTGTSVMEVTSAIGWNLTLGTVTTFNNNVNRVFQLAVEKTTGKTWIRTGDSTQTNGWSSWSQIYNSTDFVSSSSGGNFGNGGYQKLPSGLTFQWGEFTGASGGSPSMPLTPAHNVLKAFANPYGGALYTAQTTSKNLTYFNIVHNAPTGTIIFWWALTY